jgi:DNA-directed RNA polymerase specialized sigma24 family protein
MSIPEAVSSERAGLVYQHHERLYRLALLMSGTADRAATLVERAYRELPSDSADAEAQLIRALLRRAPRRRRTPPIDAERLPYVALDQAQAAALLNTLAALPAPARLAIGLHYLRGISAGEIEQILSLPAPERKGHRAQAAVPIGEILTHFRIGAARALHLLPDDIDDAALADLDRASDGLLSDAATIALRRAVFEQPALRAARDAIAEARDLLARAIPALFAATPPPALTERLLTLNERRQRAELRPSLTRARAGLALGVLTLVALIILAPTWLSRRATPTLARVPSAAELIDSAMHRFDRAPLQAGVLHEQYRIADGADRTYLIERWYDYAAPHRLAVSVSREGRNGQPLLQIYSDGRSLVQYRYGDRSFASRPVDAHVSQAEAQAALAVLRGAPSADPFTRGRAGPVDIAPLYLAQARAAGATFLGQTRALDRSAFLLTYRTDRLPAQPGQAAPQQPSQVILTIDAQTYALLDSAVVADSVAASSTLRPLQAQVFELLPSVPDSQWRLPTTARVEQRTGLPSARTPSIPSTQVIGLDDALRRTSNAILAPQQLPSAEMRGLAVPLADSAGAERVALLYEGEFQSLLLRPFERRDSGQPANGAEHSAGDFRYQLVDLGDQQSSIAAVAYRPEAPGESVLIRLVDVYATDDERTALLGQIIGSLTPLTEQNLPALRRNFYGSALAGGQS